MTPAEVLLAEYTDLRGEIHQRVSNQLLVLGGNVALLAGVLPAYDRLKELAPLSFLALPILFSIVAWLYFEQDIFLTQAATYLHKELGPRLSSVIQTGSGNPPVPLFQWERFRGEVLFQRTRERRLLATMIVFRYLATMGPGIGGLALGLTNLRWGASDYKVRAAAGLMVLIDLTLVSFLTYLARLVIRLYREISE